MDEFLKRLQGQASEDGIEGEIMQRVSEGYKKGVLDESEAEMIGNIFSLEDKDCSDILIPRKHMTALDGERTLKEVLPDIADSTFSRFPVYETDEDHVIGILHIKDVLALIARQEDIGRPIKEIPDLMQKAVFIPESKSIKSLLPELREQKTHMAIVVDEYGQTAGIIAMEDVLEEIVGNILDEHDTEERGIMKQRNGFFIPGDLSPEEVFPVLSIETEAPDFDTMSGFLINELGHIPEKDERPVIEVFGYRFHVLTTEKHMITRIHAEKA